MDNPLSLLSTVVGVVDPRKLAIYAAVTTALCGFSFVGGCVHKEHTYAAEQLRNVEATARSEKSDAVANGNASTKFQVAQTKEAGTTANVKAATVGKPVTIIKTRACPVVPPVAQPDQKVEEHKDEPTETVEPTAVAYFSIGALRLYDVSLTGLDNFPGRASEETSTVQVDEGFRQVVTDNNEQCREVTRQLNSLIDLIQEKQRIQKEGK
jgi:hypothetical protein